MKQVFRTFATLGLAAMVTLPVAAQSNIPHPEKFTAFAVDSSNMTTRAQTSQVDITINRWSTDADRDRLIDILKSKGQDALLEALQKLPVVGYINAPGSLRYDLHFARQRPTAEGGRMIFLMTDRYISAWEAANRPRTVDYPFMLIQLELDRTSQGVGKASVYTKITATHDNTIELENFANVPVMLNDVKPAK
jgi:hypothetical protein